ncbi:hypothetical protein JCM7686_0770 [Paracoccus aminophilus JCM 7686]|uniref:DUF192 domain-containing protein n=1 Tax=Paracoccus aminophilus JCM 7686 TaxID=1367847 RepID=S5XKY8_PARAH|nr:hypothetical protein JCM7686_0770 [Paracoccus aminophilus JCM 7686]
MPLLAVLTPPVGAVSFTCSPDKVVFATLDGATSISVEIADTEAERARGLMFREHLGEKEGMLFIYDSPRPVAFWMKNTVIPLDMVFLDARGVIRLIHSNARPHDETPIPGAAPGDDDPARLMVLELAGGEAARLGLEPGMGMASTRLPQSGAVLPCP